MAGCCSGWECAKMRVCREFATTGKRGIVGVLTSGGSAEQGTGRAFFPPHLRTWIGARSCHIHPTSLTGRRKGQPMGGSDRWGVERTRWTCRVGNSCRNQSCSLSWVESTNPENGLLHRPAHGSLRPLRNVERRFWPCVGANELDVQELYRLTSARVVWIAGYKG